MEDQNLKDTDCTTRTAYLVTGEKSCLVFMSARQKRNGGGKDKTYVAETTDGGKTFHFVSWVVPLSDPNRAVMPAVARLKDGTMVAALRRRFPGNDKEPCWVDVYGSHDNGRTWSFLSKVGETGTGNGNPPALVALKDGRLACAYGDRSRVKLFARLSSDGGRSWGEETVLRDDFQPDKFGDKDFGYPRLVQNSTGELVAIYYWAIKDRFE
ncbi:MAG: sialidase family protein, partial [Verrucomicrobia bacterium]|nr:sialidase family protein [Verrucomicrobiota bacterium]